MQTDRAYLPGARTGAGLQALQSEVGRLLALFEKAGAEFLDPPALLPADVLIDLYGEDIRARAYTMTDPAQGEMLLRPDFTVPVVQLHMRDGSEPARYMYSGQVWRRQAAGSTRPNEYLQVGFERFDRGDAAAIDAEVFCLMQAALGDLPVQAATGDLGILRAAVQGLTTSDARRAALMRHMWRPARFKHLLERYSAPARPSEPRKALLEAVHAGRLGELVAGAAPLIGLRSFEDIEARAAVLVDEAAQPPLDAGEVAVLNDVLALAGMVDEIAPKLDALAEKRPALGSVAAQFADRAAALRKAGVDTARLPFEASFGRTTLEYYDGFVFGFQALNRPDLPQIAQGGRYDAMTAVLGQGQGIPAIGGILRPEALLAAKGGK
ncbi:ATP phosphoribosyltransferase regulatory subunit [Abyssibius alkaniclasticus]|uniref:ATP phosphoribosyltransferase regulatory subunit n=1 Tax=Abyssibius alkaniclasticus TaxID=2881234 RepID=UPI00405908EC